MDNFIEELGKINYKIGQFEEAIKDIKKDIDIIAKKMSSLVCFEDIDDIKRAVCYECKIYDDVKRLKQFILSVLVISIIILNFFSNGALLSLLLELLKAF